MKMRKSNLAADLWINHKAKVERYFQVKMARKLHGPPLDSVLLSYYPNKKTPQIEISIHRLWLPILMKIILCLTFPILNKSKSVILLGDSNIGKTSLIKNLRDKVFPDNDPFHTIGERSNDFTGIVPGVRKLVIFDDQNFRH